VDLLEKREPNRDAFLYEKALKNPFRFSSFIAILKALFNLSVLASFQTNWMIETVFIGLERFFLVKIIILKFFFLSLPNNVLLTSELYKNYKN
jgi:hypothetical protein